MYDQFGNKVDESAMGKSVAVFCVGNRLHQDDGIGPAVYDEVLERFVIPENVFFFDVGVLTMDMIRYVDICDAIVTVDAVENSGYPAGTIVRFTPDDLDRGPNYMMSLHDLKLVDLFDAAVMLGYEAEGVCLGMQVEQTEPQFLTSELSPAVEAAKPQLVETLAAEMARLGAPFIDKQTGEPYAK